jgi:tetratricopeptide (TPR) repeat protein
MANRRAGGRAGWWLGWSAVAVLGLGVFLLQAAIDRNRQRREKLKAADELMYFPSGKLLAAIAGEYRLLVADYAWLQIAQYSGAHMGMLNQEENYRWVGNATEVVGELDPRFVAPFVFGAQMLGWEAEQPREGIALLRKGFERNPLAWELPFQAGFIAYMLTKDFDQAGYYFSVAAQLPGVWQIAPRMAAACYAQTGNFELTREMWTRTYEDQPNPKVREIAHNQLVLLIGQELGALQAAADSFVRLVGRPPASLEEVVERGYVGQIPAEPFGGSYVWRAGKVRDSNLEYVQAAIGRLQQLADRYHDERHTLPGSVDDLVRVGYLKEVPAEPFGGSFVITDGKVSSTSKLP